MLEKRVRRQVRAKERQRKGRPRRRRKKKGVTSSGEKERKRELKRLLSGSETLFLAAYWLSLSAWLLGGGTPCSHWCHSPVNRPDRRTIGPHVVVRKLSVSHAAAAYDIIQDQVWSMHTQTVHVTKNIHAYMLNLEIQTLEITYHQHLFPTTPKRTYTHSHLTPCGLHLMALPIPWLSSPPLCSPKALVTGRTTTLGHLHTRTYTQIHSHTYICTHDSWTVRQPKRKSRFVHTSWL